MAGTVVASLGIAGALALTAGGAEPAGNIVFTQLPAGAADARPGDEFARRFPARSQIVSVDPLDPEEEVRVLTEDFRSARAPAVSPDGTRMVFSGQRQEGGPWKIWEMDLLRRRARLVTPVEGATDPAYLADGGIVFSAPAGADRRPAGGASKAQHALFRVDPRDGANDSEPERITFHPGDDASPTVLRDGRLLFVMRPSAASPITRLMTMRADGTAAELYYEDRNGGRQTGRAWETPDGRVVLVERADMQTPGGGLVAISEHRPLHSRVELGSGVRGSFHSLVPLSSEEILVSYRPPDGASYGLYAFDPRSGRLTPVLDPGPEHDAIEPVAAVARPVPKRFESVVDPQRATGELYCLDADHSDLPPTLRSGPSGSSAGSASVRIRSATGTLGEVPLEEDGSFYIELPADTPVRLETLDAAGRLVRGPSAWIWVRPNERRGCIGCHEDRELAPENRVPRAVQDPPVVLPTAISGAAAEGKEVQR